MNNIVPHYIDQKLRLPWRLTCQVACQALIHKVTFEEFVVAAMRAEVQQAGS